MSDESKASTANRLGRFWGDVRRFWKPKPLDDLDFAEVRAKTPAPVFWLFGKTQSGKTSIIRYLTGAEDATIGNGFRPCTKTSRIYPFPSDEAPVLTFLDTRGLDEPSYDPAEDLASFDSQAQLMIVTCRLRDFAHGNLRDSLRKVRAVNKRRPVVLALTCLHESYPQQQHPQPYLNSPADTFSLIEKQKQEFAGLFDFVVPIDLTKPSEGFEDCEYGGAALKSKLVELLPTAYRETMLRLDGMNAQFKEAYLKRAIPIIIGYSTLAATAGAIPIPFVDLFVLPSIQVRMVKALADMSGSPGGDERFLELSASIGIGLLARQAIRQVAKFIPYVGSAVGAGLAYSSTYALGRAFIEYDQAAHAGHAPDAETVKKIYRDHVHKAETTWGTPGARMRFHLPAAAKLRIAVVATLFTAPLLFLLGTGLYHIWDTGHTFEVWCAMALCFFTAYGLAWHWTRRQKALLMPKVKIEAPSYWTDRDREAWALVQVYSESVPALSADDLSDMTRYAADAKTLVEKVAAIYRPGAKDPFGHLTLPEILACGELVAADLAELVDKYVPGSHALSVNNFKHVRKAVDWYERGRNLYWVFSAILDPVKAGAQILATKAGLQTTLKQVQNNVLTWFYTTYLQELGRYLIELNSGRLRVGVKRYRELLAQKDAPPAEPGTPEVTVVPDPTATGERMQTDPNRITIAIVGPVKAGKSSLVNAIFGEQKAGVASVPLIAAATRYDLHPEGFTPLSLIDTAGFGHNGAGDADVAGAAEVFAKSDIALLVVPARSAARKPEVEFLERVRALFAKRPELRLPPVVLVVSNIDALSPAMEWSPPYDWKTGLRPKEESIREAIAAAKEQFAKGIVDAIPVCTAHDREYGVKDELLATLAHRLDDARGVQLLRVLHAEASADKTRKVIGQALNAGKEALKLLWQNAQKPKA